MLARSRWTLENMANQRDRQILNSIINPLLPIGEGVHDLEQECFASDLQEEVYDREETRVSRQYEKEGIDAAEKGNIEDAIALFGQGMYTFMNRTKWIVNFKLY